MLCELIIFFPMTGRENDDVDDVVTSLKVSENTVGESSLESQGKMYTSSLNYIHIVILLNGR